MGGNDQSSTRLTQKISKSNIFLQILHSSWNSAPVTTSGWNISQQPSVILRIYFIFNKLSLFQYENSMRGGVQSSQNFRSSVIKKNSPLNSPTNKSAPDSPWSDNKSSGSSSVLQQFDMSMFDKQNCFISLCLIFILSLSHSLLEIHFMPNTHYIMFVLTLKESRSGILLVDIYKYIKWSFHC